MIELAIPEEAQLEAFARRLAGGMQPPLVIYLEGPLGAGKTTFVRAVARALGHGGRVKSPTYGLMERYDFNDLALLHLDLYRIEDPAELDYLALRDLFGEDTVLFIEWPRRGGSEIPPPDIRVRFSDDVQDRRLSAIACSAAGDSLISDISRQFKNSILE